MGPRNTEIQLMFLFSLTNQDDPLFELPCRTAVPHRRAASGRAGICGACEERDSWESGVWAPARNRVGVHRTPGTRQALHQGKRVKTCYTPVKECDAFVGLGIRFSFVLVLYARYGVFWIPEDRRGSVACGGWDANSHSGPRNEHAAARWGLSRRGKEWFVQIPMCKAPPMNESSDIVSQRSYNFCGLDAKMRASQASHASLSACHKVQHFWKCLL